MTDHNAALPSTEVAQQREKTILKLKLNTDPRWVDIASKNIGDILVDHAYCEQKAASTGISLIVSYPEKTRLVDELTELVAEEWSHFERVLQELRKRGLPLGRPRRDEYVVELLKHVRRGGARERQLMDQLLVSALIEARSCERFKLLWKHIPDQELSKFYYELMVSEAGHFVAYVDLAKEYCDPQEVDARLQELLKIEGDIVTSLPVRDDRMH
ncbi:tRNA-(ms[2]io[6]A)-hydroxylase [Hymenobacter jeollabukensis]|uniref:tRNA-(Ms[2]io[6]A)-hydroxylase n=1 Tax=Hymenobacter jeollabukensis TaxID=2025313 RepID=A0A5R8WPW3_9BACT|nr:tRNA-(ms[2]io[6]A)-hydroxylase [Hymenobacter jeollabukensis]TLM91803.1 tRNA-(ms[2]io[6]A)-hydroxylase [Hymenobacter jeollabukensis]